MLWDRTQPHDERHELFGGRRAVRVWNLTPRDMVSPFSVALACELEPGGSVGTHRQAEDCEILVVIEGDGACEVGGGHHALVPGTVVPLALGQTLAIENRSDDVPLRYLIIKARAPAP